MNRLTVVVTLVVLVLGLFAFAQEEGEKEVSANPPASSNEQSTAGTDSSEGSSSAPPQVSLSSGDKIVLKSGTVLEGMQVLRETPTYYEVQVLESTVTMRLPRRQVESIEYDDINPLAGQKAEQQESLKKNEPILLPGHEMPSQFLKDISDPPLKFEQQDLMLVLEEVGRRAQANITIDDSIRAFPEDKRLWTYEGQPGTTAAAVLDSLAATFDYIRVVYQKGGAVVIAKEAPPAPAESESPAPAEASSAEGTEQPNTTDEEI